MKGFREYIIENDFEQIRRMLRRIVYFYPLRDTADDEKDDFVQELFLRLWAKNRFQHYLETNMTDARIAREITYVELKNLVTEIYRRRRPETFRLARRISEIVTTDRDFRPRDKNRCRLKHKIYGLTIWESKPTRSLEDIEIRVKDVSFPRRDHRSVGRTGAGALIISNRELKHLMVNIFIHADSPLSIADLRTVTIARLGPIDASFLPLFSSGNDGDLIEFDYPDPRAGPEQIFLRTEAEGLVGSIVNVFLKKLTDSVRGKSKQFRLMIQILDNFYLNGGTTQFDLARSLNVSDSLISNYRRRIENILQSLPFSYISQARQFKKALNRYLKSTVFKG